jgi:hypothetical protein
LPHTSRAASAVKRSVLALRILLAFVPSVANAGGPLVSAHSQVQTHAAMKQTGLHQTVAPSAANFHREIFGVALASSLSDPTVGYPSWDFSLLSTVAFFGLP